MAKQIAKTAGAPGAPPAAEAAENTKPAFETLEEAVAHIAKVDQNNADLANQLTEAKGIITDLKAQVKAAKEARSAEIKQPTIEIDGVKYQVNHGAHGIGDAAALAKNEDACRKILANKGQNALTKI